MPASRRGLATLTTDERATLHELLLRAAGDQLPSCPGEVVDESPCQP